MLGEGSDWILPHLSRTHRKRRTGVYQSQDMVNGDRKWKHLASWLVMLGLPCGSRVDSDWFGTKEYTDRDGSRKLRGQRRGGSGRLKYSARGQANGTRCTCFNSLARFSPDTVRAVAAKWSPMFEVQTLLEFDVKKRNRGLKYPSCPGGTLFAVSSCFEWLVAAAGTVLWIPSLTDATGRPTRDAVHSRFLLTQQAIPNPSSALCVVGRIRPRISTGQKFHYLFSLILLFCVLRRCLPMWDTVPSEDEAWVNGRCIRKV